MNIHIIYGLIVAITLIIFLVTLFVVGGKRSLPKSSKVEDFKLKGSEMTKKNSLKKSEAKVLAAKMIKDLVDEEMHDQDAMDERLEKLNLTDSGERKFYEAIEEMVAVVLKKAKITE